MQMPRIVSSAALLAACGLAHAQSCGDTITGNVTLTGDLHCTTGWLALDVPTSGITIDLNGYTISGTHDLAGIRVDGDSVTIKNGRIEGFWGGVVGGNAHGLVVQDLVFAGMDGGVILVDSDAAQISRNRFDSIVGDAIGITTPAGSKHAGPGGHYVGYNIILNSGTGIHLCGHATGNSQIVGNEMEDTRDSGIHLEEASNGHDVSKNSIASSLNTAIVVRGSRDNTIAWNHLKGGRLGIAFLAQFAGACATGPVGDSEVRDNLVDGNSVFYFDNAITLGQGVDSTARVLKNKIRYNKFYYGGTGLFFQTDAHFNDAAIGNAYSGTGTPVVDDGFGNGY